MQSNLCVDNGAIADLPRFEKALTSKFENRKANARHYSEQELSYVASFEHKLLPEDIDLDFRSLENLRVLANFSQFELKIAREISSHRKYIGPLIVFFKKASWPFIKIHLKETFDGLSELSAWSLKTLSQHLVEIDSLKKRVDELEKKLK